MTRTWWCLACSFAVLGCATPQSGHGPDVELTVAGGRAVGFDDLWFAGGHVLATDGAGGALLTLSPGGVVTVATGLSGPESADEGDGFFFVAERGAGRVTVLSAGGARLDAAAVPGLDYVRWVPAHREVWASAPGRGVFTFALATDGHLTAGPIIETPGGPEGLTISADGAVALVHLGNGEVGVIDVATHALTARWPTGCGDLHGFPQLDAAAGLIFAGCRDRPEVVVVRRDDGAVLGRARGTGGATVLAWSPRLRHFYLRGDPSTVISVLGVAADGKPVLLGTLDAAPHGHAMVADPAGPLWACDADRGRVLGFTDPFPETAP